MPIHYKWILCWKLNLKFFYNALGQLTNPYLILTNERKWSLKTSHPLGIFTLQFTTYTGMPFFFTNNFCSLLKSKWMVKKNSPLRISMGIRSNVLLDTSLLPWTQVSFECSVQSKLSFLNNFIQHIWCTNKTRSVMWSGIEDCKWRQICFRYFAKLFSISFWDLTRKHANQKWIFSRFFFLFVYLAFLVAVLPTLILIFPDLKI